MKIFRRNFGELTKQELKMLMTRSKQRKYNLLGVSFQVEELDSGKFNVIMEYYA
jgi:hypothetical protein